MKPKQQLYFPTPIYTARVDDPEPLNEEMLQLVYDERRRDPSGTERSNYRELGGWHSHINLHRDPAYRPLLEQIDATLRQISEDSGYDPGYRLTVSSMWAIVNEPGSSNRAHIHPKCLWSGVYYIQTPVGCGPIQFTDPRTANIMNQPRYIPNRKRPQSHWTKVTFQPEAGKMVVFPSWLYHSVAPNLSGEAGPSGDRVIISFNVSQTRRT